MSWLSASFPHNDTIAATSTPPGRGGIGVVRISGEGAQAILRKLVGECDRSHARASVAAFRSENGDYLDTVVVTCFHAPHSYTGEDVVEISAHGSPVVLGYILERAIRGGARLAEPGEFTRRAFLAGKIDLTQAEAVRDLIDSHTLFQAQLAAQQMHGSVARGLQPAKSRLTRLIAGLEAGIDFADDDVSVMPQSRVLEALDPLILELRQKAATFGVGRTISHGLTLAIVGRPNVGKSSLFNRLLETDRAIVTPQPGTTRDLIAEQLNLGGVPVRLLDTAGIHFAASEPERIGIQKTWQAAADADILLAVFDRSAAISEEDHQLIRRVPELRNLVLVQNKSDLPIAGTTEAWEQLRRTAEGRPWFSVSALTGEGIPEMREALRAIALPGIETGGEFITNARHAQHLNSALENLNHARQASVGELPHEMLLVDLYGALKDLDAITGQTTVEDILGVVFSSFCVGK